MKKPKTYLHPFQDELVFYPNKKGKACKFCGICSFAHKHKAGTLPKDFEKIPERVPDVGKTITKRTLELITALLDCVCNQIRPDDKKWIEYSGEKVAEIYELIKTIDEKPNKKTNI